MSRKYGGELCGIGTWRLDESLDGCCVGMKVNIRDFVYVLKGMVATSTRPSNPVSLQSISCKAVPHISRGSYPITRPPWCNMTIVSFFLCMVERLIKVRCSKEDPPLTTDNLVRNSRISPHTVKQPIQFTCIKSTYNDPRLTLIPKQSNSSFHPCVFPSPHARDRKQRTMLPPVGPA